MNQDVFKHDSSIHAAETQVEATPCRAPHYLASRVAKRFRPLRFRARSQFQRRRVLADMTRVSSTLESGAGSREMGAARSRRFSRELFTPRQWRGLGTLLRLTPRQLSVARLLCADCSQREIASRMSLAHDTVGTHLKGLYRRLGVRSQVAVVVQLVLAERTLECSLGYRTKSTGGPLDIVRSAETPGVTAGIPGQ